MSSTRPPRRNGNKKSTQRMEQPKSQNVNQPRNISPPGNQNLDRPSSQPNQPVGENRNQPFRNTSQLFDYQLRVSKWLFTVERFLLCIPLKAGSYVIATISLAKSIIILSLVVLVICNYSSYLEVYERKMDVFICVLVYFSSCVPFLVTSIFLIIGTYMEKPILVKVYLWGSMMHVFVCILNSLTFAIYCVINNNCFQGTGKAHIVISFVYLFMYTVIWLYLLSTINSLLTLQIAAHKLKAETKALETSLRPVNQPLRPNANQSLGKKRQNVNRTGNRPVNRPSRPNANRTSSPNKSRPSNQPVKRSPKRSIK